MAKLCFKEQKTKLEKYSHDYLGFFYLLLNHENEM